MDAKFFDDLNLKNGRHTVAAGGPCHWEAGDAWAEIKNVTIEQVGVVATSRCWARTTLTHLAR
jgi:hypothetical protein